MTAPQPDNDDILVRWSDLLAKLNDLKNELLGGAGDAYDTLGELAALLEDNADLATSLAEQLAQKAPASHKHSVGDITTGNAASATTFLRGDGQWIVPTNTTYLTMTEDEATAGKATTARTITAAVLRAAVAIFAEKKVWQGTKAQYDALTTKDPDRLYLIEE